MKKLFIVISLVLVLFSLTFVSADPGSIWTTRDDCGAQQQNANQYFIGEDVYVNGNNFSPGFHSWDITGQPGQASCDPNIVVASGSYTVDATQEFCFNAYTIENDDCGTYKVTFDGKNDNYIVVGQAPIVPEFGIIIGILTIVSAVGVFFFVRR